MKLFPRIVIGAAAASLLLAGSARAADKVRFMLASVPDLPSFALHRIADHLGYYKEAGIDIEFMPGKGGVDAATQLGAGNADISSGIGDTSMIVRANGVTVKGIVLIGGGSLMVLATPVDSGLTSPKDLKGKAISVISYTDTTYYSLLGALASAGLSKNDVDIQALGPVGMTQAFIDGKVQAIATVPDFIPTIENAGIKVNLYPASTYTPSMAQAVLTSDEMIAKKPDLVKRLAGVTKRVFVQFKNDPAGMAKVYVEAVPIHKAKQAEMTRIFSLYSKYAYQGQPTPGAFDSATVENMQDFYVKNSIIRRASPVADLFDNRFVAQ